MSPIITDGFSDEKRHPKNRGDRPGRGKDRGSGIRGVEDDGTSGSLAN
jgi:hypothetical protein